MHILCTAARFDDRRMTINQNELQNRKKNVFSVITLDIDSKDFIGPKEGIRKRICFI